MNLKQRCPLTLISTMLCFIPEDKTALRDELERIAESALFRAPEMQRTTFMEISRAMDANVSKPPSALWERFRGDA